MLWMITKFIFCLLLAGVLGFMLGFVFSKLLQRDRDNEKYTLLEDKYDNQKGLINQYLSEMRAKDGEIESMMNRYQASQRELIELKLDYEELEKKCSDSHDTSELELENNTLKEEISEYQYLENENALLLNEIKSLESEKEKLLNKIEKCQEDEPQLLPKKLKDTDTLKREIKKAKKSISKAYQLLKKGNEKKG